MALSLLWIFFKKRWHFPLLAGKHSIGERKMSQSIRPSTFNYEFICRSWRQKIVPDSQWQEINSNRLRDSTWIRQIITTAFPCFPLNPFIASCFVVIIPGICLHVFCFQWLTCMFLLFSFLICIFQTRFVKRAVEQVHLIYISTEIDVQSD